jgi:hypothetical protein
MNIKHMMRMNCFYSNQPQIDIETSSRLHLVSIVYERYNFYIYHIRRIEKKNRWTFILPSQMNDFDYPLPFILVL